MINIVDNADHTTEGDSIALETYSRRLFIARIQRCGEVKVKGASNKIDESKKCRGCFTNHPAISYITLYVCSLICDSQQ